MMVKPPSGVEVFYLINYCVLIVFFLGVSVIISSQNMSLLRPLVFAFLMSVNIDDLVADQFATICQTYNSVHS